MGDPQPFQFQVLPSDEVRDQKVAPTRLFDAARGRFWERLQRMGVQTGACTSGVPRWGPWGPVLVIGEPVGVF